MRGSISARIIPITIMDMARLQRPMVCTGVRMTAGTCAPVSIRSIPITQAMIQGWVATFFTVALMSVSFVKMAIPSDHIMVRTGIRKTLASIRPPAPKIPSATGLPRKPALEQMIP